jgi:NTP pyrophosphatase (non-canonical NTP hydrolase)
MELGYARALGIPVFSVVKIADEVLGDGVTVVPGIEFIESAYSDGAAHLGGGLARLQSYYKTVAEHRGWARENARDTLLLLTEEIGELARAIRRAEGLSRHQADEHQDVGGELADVQLYVVHLANTLGLDLSRAVMAKERVNAERFTHVSTTR